MNLIVVDKCTNYCAYCFASTEMAQNEKRAELSRDSIEKLIAFVQRSGPKFDLNIIGGEPFLYKDMPYLLSRLCGESAFGNATIFTGGIFSAQMLDRIAPFVGRIWLLFNLNERRDYHRSADYEVVLRNIESSLKLGVPLNIGFNIWRSDFDYQEILSVCRNFGVDRLRWTVAYPEAKPMPGVTVIPPDAYAPLARRCAEFLEAAYEQKIKAYLDCPLPKCFFTAEELGRILLTHPESATTIKSCGPAVDVGSDLSVFRCYALSGYERRHLSDFINYRELESWFERTIDDRYERPQVYEKCATCEFAEDRSCYGGCIAHSVQSIGQRPSTADLMRVAYESLSARDWQTAMAQLDKLPRQDAAAALLRSHVNLLRGAREDAVRDARLAVNRSRTPAMRTRAVALLRNISDTSAKPDKSLEPLGPQSRSIELPVLRST
jgi:radical SAM protein with 4Fe4S-binding SPASM domain